MSLCLPGGYKISERPSIGLDWSLLRAVQTFIWLYENGNCVGCKIVFVGGNWHAYDTRGLRIQTSLHLHFAERYIKHFYVYNGNNLDFCQSTYWFNSRTFDDFNLVGWRQWFGDGKHKFNDCHYKGAEKTVRVTFSWKFALLRLKHVLRLKARRRIARIVSAACGMYDDVAALIAAYVV